MIYDPSQQEGMDDRAGEGDEARRSQVPDDSGDGGEEVLSPLKRRAPETAGREVVSNASGRQLFPSEGVEGRKVVKKRKSKRSNQATPQTPDLNFPASDGVVTVPVRLVSSMVNQFVNLLPQKETEEKQEELLKKQKRATSSNDVRSAAAVGSSPAGHNESPKRELPGLRAARGSSRAPQVGGAIQARGGVFDGDKDGGGACCEVALPAWLP
jgi:hypothetical protein